MKRPLPCTWIHRNNSLSMVRINKYVKFYWMIKGNGNNGKNIHVGYRMGWKNGCRMSTPTFYNSHPKPQRPPIQLDARTVQEIIQTANALEEFFHSYDTSICMIKNKQQQKDTWHQMGWIRYRMFLYLQQQHPNTWLIPTADIEYCWMAHIIRTQVYWNDRKTLKVDGRHTLLLSREECALFPTAAQATETLWNTTFGTQYPFLPETFSLVDHCHTKEQRRYGPYTPTYHGCIPAIGTLPTTTTATSPLSSLSKLDRGGGSSSSSIELPTISLTPEEIHADRGWFKQLKHTLKDVRDKVYTVTRQRRGHDREQRMYWKNLVPSYERFLNLCS